MGTTSSSSSSTGGSEGVRGGGNSESTASGSYENGLSSGKSGGMSAFERSLIKERSRVPGLLGGEQTVPSEADWWREKAQGGATFYNVGEAIWLASREKYRTEGRRKVRPPEPEPVHYENIHSGLTSPKRTYELPGRMTLTDIVCVLNDVWEMDA